MPGCVLKESSAVDAPFPPPSSSPITTFPESKGKSTHDRGTALRPPEPRVIAKVWRSVPNIELSPDASHFLPHGADTFATSITHPKSTRKPRRGFVQG